MKFGVVQRFDGVLVRDTVVALFRYHIDAEAFKRHLETLYDPETCPHEIVEGPELARLLS